MTGDEYLVKRILELEEENTRLKNRKQISVLMHPYDEAKPFTLKVKVKNDHIDIEAVKENGNDWICNNFRN